MEVKPKTTEEFIVGAEKEMEFSIDTDNHIIFDILRDKMYSDKIGAVAREVASNSRDANREAGNSSTPVRVRVVKPNKFTSIGHQSIIFEDNGLGITPDRMSDVFIKYASSTKRDSNNETGGFGLGAKTPFAYTDTFSVITVCDYAEPIYEQVRVDKHITLEQYNEMKQMDIDVELLDEIEEDTTVVLVNMNVTKIVGHEPIKRKEYTYNAIIDKSNKGKMILFDSEETTEPTGTKIVVPIKTDSDKMEFERKVRKYTKYWGDGIEYLGFYTSDAKVVKVVDEDDFMIVESNDSEPYGMLIDGIDYPLNKTEVGISDSGASDAFKILLKFNTGELTISANREAVQYDKDTVEKIKQKYEVIKEHIKVLATEYITNLPSFVEACKTSYYFQIASLKQRSIIEDKYLRVLAECFNSKRDWGSKSTILSDSKEKLEVKFDGKDVTPELKLEHHTIAYIKQPRYSHDKKVDYSSAKKVGITEKFINSTAYYADTRKNRRRNLTIWEDHNTFMLIFPNPKSEEADRKAELKEFTTKYGIDYKLYSTVEMQKVERDYTSSKETGFIHINVRTRRYSHFNMASVKVNRATKKFDCIDPKECVYFEVPLLSDTQLYKNGTVTQKMDFVRKHADKYTIIANEPAIRNWLKHTGMTTLEEEYETLQKKYKAEWEKYTKLDTFRNLFDEVTDIGATRLHQFSDIFEELVPKSMRGLGIFDKKVKVQGYVKQELKFDFEGLKSKLNRIFAEDYPMLMPYLNSQLGRYRTEKPEKIRKVIEKYIKS